MSDLPTGTERLSLRLPEEQLDLDDLLALDSDPEVMRYIGDGSLRDDPVDKCAMIQAILSFAQEHPGQAILMAHEKSGGAFVGWAALKSLDRREEVEVGYRLARRAWGQGYATELARALVAHGFEALDLPLVVGITHPEHLASQRVLTKTGLRHVGEDHCYGTEVLRFELSQPDWRRLPDPSR